MSDTLYYIASGILVLLVLLGIALMSKMRRASMGNALSGVCMAAAIFVTLYKYGILTDWALWASMAVGTAVGIAFTFRVRMIQMPQAVALLNGLGGAASAIVGWMELLRPSVVSVFASATAALAVVVGMLTLTGSLVAAAKLNGMMTQRPIVWKGHAYLTGGSLVTSLLLVALLGGGLLLLPLSLVCVLISGFFGVAFAVRVGGADMPITISLLNSFSGVAAGIAGLAIADPLLVAIGGIVGASGLLLTQIMCKAMNRSLFDILMGKTSVATAKSWMEALSENAAEPSGDEEEAEPVDIGGLLRGAKRVIIVPGYGMALSQAQEQVKRLVDVLEKNGAVVQFAIHPVAGRMPGHMNVLLAEVDIPYDQLFEMDQINPEFAACDACIVIGANDVINPAANTEVGTPIYGMPILNVQNAPHIILCNFDKQPGYAGVDNPLYSRTRGVTLMLGDAKASLEALLERLA